MNELRLKRGRRVRENIRQFSATEKAVFGVFVLAALVCTVIMAAKVNGYFLIETPGYGGTLHEGIIGLPRTINPVLAITDADRDLSALIYAGLMRYEGVSLVTDIAQSYEISKDGLTYSFKLRPDVRFQDGHAVTANDIAFTVQKIQDPALKSPRRADWANVTVKTISPTEIQFTLKQPYSPFLTNTTIGILPKHIWNEINDEQFIFSQYNIQPVGAGAYKVDSISRDQSGIPTVYNLTVWRGYHGKRPFLKNIAFNYFADEEKALAALDSGTIDSLASISSTEGVRLSEDSAQGYRILSDPLPRVFGIFFNQGQAPALADKSARQALNMSVDRTAIVKSVLNGYGLAIDGPLPPSIVDIESASSSKNKVAVPDLAGAIALLEKNGWKKNAGGVFEKKSKSGTVLLAFDIYTADTPDLKQAAELVKKSWTALGADVSVKVFEPSDLYQNIIRTRKYEALLFGELVGKDRDMYAFWHSSQRNAPGLNVSLYANSAADKALEDIRGSTDEKSRQKSYVTLNDLIRADIPAVFLYSPDFIYAVPKTLHGIRIDSITTPSDRWNSVGSWYLNTEKVWSVFKNF